MIRFVRTICIAALLLAAAAVQAQTLPIGKRVPDVKPEMWLDGLRPMRESKLTCIEFFHPSSKRCLDNIKHLLQLSGEFLHKDFQVVVVASGDPQQIDNLLKPYTDEGIAVGIDTDGQCFKAFGVVYLPACVLIDDQKKVVWTGDSRLMSARFIEVMKK